ETVEDLDYLLRTDSAGISTGWLKPRGSEELELSAITGLLNRPLTPAFWGTEDTFEVSERMAALWSLFTNLSCPIVNRPSAHGFFPNALHVLRHLRDPNIRIEDSIFAGCSLASSGQNAESAHLTLPRSLIHHDD